MSAKTFLPGHIFDDAQKTLSDSVMRLKENQLNESKIFYSNTSKEAQQRKNELARRQHGRGGRGVGWVVKCLYNTGQAQHAKTRSILVDMV